MEVSTASPPPTSPAKGYDPCQISVTYVAIAAITLLVCLFGLAGNGTLLCLLGFHTHRKPITVYILHMAITDFVFLLLIAAFSLLYLLEYASCSIIMPQKYLMLLFQLALFSYNLGLYLLAAISFYRCRSTFCPLCCHCHRPKHESMVVSAMLGAISITVIPTLTSLFQYHDSKSFHEFVNFMYILNLLLFASSMVISTTTLFIKTKCDSQHQQPKSLDIVIFLTVLFGLPSSIGNFMEQLNYNIDTEDVFLLTCIHSTIKPIIYFLVARCWKNCSVGSLRESLQRVFEKPEENSACSNDPTMDTVV